MKTATVRVSFNLKMLIDDDADIQHVMNELYTSFIDTTDQADVRNSEMLDFEIVDCD
jgi:hypothetical protein